MVSYLKPEEQTSLLKIMEQDGTVPSLSQAQRLKQYSREERLTEDVMDAILTEGNAEKQKVTLQRNTLKKYFPESYTSAQMESVIFSLLEKWKKDQEPEA